MNSTPTMISFCFFWGKTFISDSGDTFGYPAICHMLDVSLVALSLLERAEQIENFNPRFQIHTHEQAKWIAFLVALHDLGKVSPGFQAKQPGLFAAPKALFPFSKWDEKDHGRVTFATLPTILEQRIGCSFETADQLSRAVAAHHGTFHHAEQSPNEVGEGAWHTARVQIVDALLECFDLTWENCPFVEDSYSNSAFTLFLAGLTSVADWLGSDPQHFSCTIKTTSENENFCLKKYYNERLPIARSVVDELNLKPSYRRYPHHTFGELFQFDGKPAQPNSTQQTLLRLISELNPHEPAFVLVETPMGSGKTEAALSVVAQWLADGVIHGLYYALPTRATANAMLGRVLDFLKRTTVETTQLHLLHASADLQAEYQALLNKALKEITPKDIYDGEERDPFTVRADEWFTSKKRGLISPYSVGTLDQALMAVLKQARHFFVRLYGLSGKAVIIDEAHAYDTYTSELLENLLLWLAALRIPVVVLSATLPERKREKLLHRYAPNATLPSQVQYPCVLAVQPSSNKVIYHTVDCSDSNKTFILEYLERREEQHHDTVEQLLQTLLQDGGCALCIVNTVDEAQALYQHLAMTLDVDDNLYLFHARFPLEERLITEERMKRLFGRDPSERPRRAVLVATQVAEQSLDADFDLLITHLAPIDLLFQRMGRVYRHNNKHRPEKLYPPRVICLTRPLIEESDLENCNVNNDTSIRQLIRKHFGMSGLVYSPEVLLKTSLVLREKAAGESTLHIPRDIQSLISKVYGPANTSCPDHLTEVMIAFEDRDWISNSSEQREAKSGTLPHPEDSEFFMKLAEKTLDEDRLMAQTRLARVSITLVPLYWGSDNIFFLHAERTTPIDLDQTPDRAMVDRLIRRTLSISKSDWVAHFKEQKPPKAWANSPHLRHLRLLKLDIDGRYVDADRWIMLDSRRGLLFGG